MYRTVHITPDEKFIDRFVKRSDRLVDLRDHLFLCWSENVRPSVIRYAGVETAREADLSAVVRRIKESGAERIIYHGLPVASQKLSVLLPEDLEQRWIFYGFEYYSLAGVKRALLLPETKQWWEGQGAGWRQRFRRWKLNRKRAKRLKSAILRMSGIAHWIPEDVRRVKKYFGVPQLAHYDFCYCGGLGKPLDVMGNDVLVGNSADPTNNHFEVLRQLKTLDTPACPFDRVIVPLSYPEKFQRYADEVSAVGRELFGDRFVAMRELLPLADYLQVIGSARVAIMGHLRSQAGANIRYYLNNDKRVVLDHRNPMYGFFKQRQYRIYSLSNQLAEALAKDERKVEQSNSQLIQQQFAGEAADDYYRNLFGVSR